MKPHTAALHTAALDTPGETHAAIAPKAPENTRSISVPESAEAPPVRPNAAVHAPEVIDLSPPITPEAPPAVAGSAPEAVEPQNPIAEVAPAGGAPVAEIPAPIQSALHAGAPVVFTSSGENQAANRQPDYFLTPEGQFVPNPQATPSPDGTINIQMQTADPRGNQSLRDAIIYESEMQKASAREMIRYFQKDHPGVPIPDWMNSLASARPNVPDFIPPAQSQPSQSPSAAPENGFVNRGVHGGHGSAGFANNGGFDGNGQFQGNGSTGDGSLNSGGNDRHSGRPLEGGEVVQAKSIYDYLTSQYGLTPVVASGILGNMMTESSMKTHAYNSSEGAIGLCQWEGGRRTELENFAAQQHKPVTDWHVQVDFMMHEFQHKEAGAWNHLQHAQTPSEAAAIFDRYFERSAGTSRHERMGNAEHVHQQLAGTPAPQPHGVPMS